MKTIKYMLLTLLVFGLCPTAVADETQERLKLYIRLAKEGNAGAQVGLAEMYHKGRGVSKDYKEAFRWYRLAADQGNPFAQYNLGLMYQNGTGVTRDYQEAKKWYQLAADQGHISAQLSLEALDFSRKEIPKEPKKEQASPIISSNSLKKTKTKNSFEKAFDRGPFTQEEVVVHRKVVRNSRGQSKKLPDFIFSTKKEKETTAKNVVKNKENKQKKTQRQVKKNMIFGRGIPFETIFRNLLSNPLVPRIYSQENPRRYLGKLGHKYDLESIFNKYGMYGNRYNLNSIWNQYGRYGSRFSMYSPFNQFTRAPPVIVLGDTIVGYLTINRFIRGGISPFTLSKLLR